MNWTQIDDWLSTTIYNNDHIPTFKRTDTKLAILNKLHSLHLNNSELIDYILLNDNIQDLRLTESGQVQLEALANLAASLGIESAELSNYMTAITSFSIERMETEQTLRSLEELDYSLNEFHRDATQLLEGMNDILTDLRRKRQNKRVEEDEQHHSKYIRNAQNEYRSLKEHFDRMEIEKKGIRLSQLYELEKKIASVEQSLQDKSDILETYRVLPPDMRQASLKMQEAEERLHKLLQEKEILLQDIAHSVQEY